VNKNVFNECLKLLSDRSDVTTNALEENSRQMDRRKKRLVFRMLIGNSEMCAVVYVHCCRAEVTAALNVEDAPAQLCQIQCMLL